MNIEFLLAENMEFVDDLLTFEELGLCLKSHGCHVANLSSTDFSAKNGIGGCLRSLLRQFLMVSLDVSGFVYTFIIGLKSGLLMLLLFRQQTCPS